MRSMTLRSFTLMLMTANTLAAEESAQWMEVGFAEGDIAPEIGMEQPGGYGKAYHRTVHDPCKVRATVFDDGEKRVALVGVDGLAVHREMVQAARKEIQAKCSIPPEAVLVGASHSHSSGPLVGVLPGQYDGESELVQKLAYKHSTCVNAKYFERVTREIVNAVCQADSNRVDAQCGVDSGVEDKVAFNRRYRMKNGLCYSHPGQGNPDVLGYAGPTDPEVGVIGAWNKEGKLLGCVVNFACHCTTSPGGASANWVYYLEKVIRAALEPDAVVVFLQGACGDVTQVDNLSPYLRRQGEADAQFVGGRVGAEAVKVLSTMQPGALIPVDYRVKVSECKRRIPSPERVKHSYEIVQKDPKEVGHTEWTFAKEIVLLDVLIRRRPVEQVEAQAIQVGPAVFISNPAEFFCQLGLDIKAKSPFPFTFPVELANDCVGYVPTEEAFGERGGGYETRLTSYSNLEPKAGRAIVEVGLALAGQLKPGKVIAPPAAPPFNGQPWSYGSAPPELE